MNEQTLNTAFGDIFGTDKPLFEHSQTIGSCEACGVTDHHLVLGLCPNCSLKYNPQGTQQ